MGKNGLCCIHNGLHKRGYGFQTMTWKRFSTLGRDKALPVLLRRYQNNIHIVSMIAKECAAKGWNYRVSSDIFPLMTHPEAGITFDSMPEPIKNSIYGSFFATCDIARRSGIRLSCHPDQFNVLASENPKAVEQTIAELNHHGWFMHLIGFYSDFYFKGKTLEEGIIQDCKEYNPGYDSPINIHLNCSKGDPRDIAKRFKDNLDRLNPSAKSRLVVETEDKGIWHTRNLVDYIHELTGVPITFDYLHHKCNPGGLTEEEAFKLCVQTWGKHKPLFHFCEALPGQNNPRKHANLPTYTPNTYGYDVDLDYEFKDKEAALEVAEKLVQNLASEALSV